MLFVYVKLQNQYWLLVHMAFIEGLLWPHEGQGWVGVCLLFLSVCRIRLIRPNQVQDWAGCSLKACVERADVCWLTFFNGVCGGPAEGLWSHQWLCPYASSHSLTPGQRPSSQPCQVVCFQLASGLSSTQTSSWGWGSQGESRCYLNTGATAKGLGGQPWRSAESLGQAGFMVCDLDSHSGTHAQKGPTLGLNALFLKVLNSFL